MRPVIKKTIFISICWHAIILNSFNFTFGNRIPKAEFAEVSFLGSILSSRDLVKKRIFDIPDIGMKRILNAPFRTSTLDKTSKAYLEVFKQDLKPSVFLAFNQDKTTFMPKTAVFSFRQREVKSVMLYPHLPYHFLLYFKDRQSVHIELRFKIVSKKGVKANNTIMVKRKISSGNLEADLLSMHYISHYLFIQQAKFTPDKWQTVKIDLSAKDD